jgi:flagellar L-ring protein precursor FlgH
MYSAIKQISLYSCFIALSACSAVDRIENIGKPPDMAPIADPVAQPGYQPV